jgi:hypothetical protein
MEKMIASIRKIQEGRSMYHPHVTIYDERSMDVYWNNEKYTILMTFDANGEYAYYADDHGESKVEAENDLQPLLEFFR